MLRLRRMLANDGLTAVYCTPGDRVCTVQYRALYTAQPGVVLGPGPDT